jgi:hypothetical protein
MSVPFKELAGSPVELFGPEGMKVQRRLVVAWEDRHRLVAELLGDGYQFGGSPPAGYPGHSGVVAVAVRLEPWSDVPDAQQPFRDVATRLNSYTGRYAQLVVEYELLDTTAGRADLPEPPVNTFLTYRMDFGGEYLALGGQSLRWQSDANLPVPPDALPTIRLPITEHHVTWHRVLRPPWGAIRACTGTVNASTFLGAPAETLLFDGAVARKKFLGLAVLRRPEFCWQVQYVFRERAIKSGGVVHGWNHRYRGLPANAPGWDRLVDANGEALYRQSDFAALFQFAP